MSGTSGFHSIVEVFLRAGVPPQEKDSALCSAVFARRLELARLLVKYCADPHALSAEDVFDSRNPELIRWMITLGLDLETRWPIARVLENRRRECLGIYMDLRDRVPRARRQAAMALRVHARDGNLKWVSLLLWLGRIRGCASPSGMIANRERIPRRALGRAERSVAIRMLKRLVEARALGEGIFRELMRTPKMKALLDNGWVGDTDALKRYAGFVDKAAARIQRRPKGQPLGK